VVYAVFSRVRTPFPACVDWNRREDCPSCFRHSFVSPDVSTRKNPDVTRERVKCSLEMVLSLTLSQVRHSLSALAPPAKSLAKSARGKRIGPPKRDCSLVKSRERVEDVLAKLLDDELGNRYGIVPELAREYGVPATTLSDWCR
jgi:hypothetical protein